MNKAIGLSNQKEYAGYFDKDTWYQWKGHPVWVAGSNYGSGAIVSSKGKLYQATCTPADPTDPTTTCKSAGASLETETGTGLCMGGN